MARIANGPLCARCGGETAKRAQFPDTFICSAGKRHKTCGFWWGRRRPSTDGPFFTPTVTTVRGYLHWSHAPGHLVDTQNRVICVVRPRGQGWRTDETVYDMTSIYLPAYDEADSMYSERTKDRALALVAALKTQGRVA